MSNKTAALIYSAAIMACVLVSSSYITDLPSLNINITGKLGDIASSISAVVTALALIYTARTASKANKAKTLLNSGISKIRSSEIIFEQRLIQARSETIDQLDNHREKKAISVDSDFINDFIKIRMAIDYAVKVLKSAQMEADELIKLNHPEKEEMRQEIIKSVLNLGHYEKIYGSFYSHILDNEKISGEEENKLNNKAPFANHKENMEVLTSLAEKYSDGY